MTLAELEEQAVRESWRTGRPFEITGMQAMAAHISTDEWRAAGWHQAWNRDAMVPDRRACARLQHLSYRLQRG